MAAIWTKLDMNSVQGAMATTESAPTDPADGCQLVGVGGFTLILEAAAGQTLTGSGTLLGYIFDPTTNAGWAYAPDLNVTIPAGANGQTRIAFPGWTVANPRDRIAHIASGVGVTAGGLAVRYICTMLKGFRS